MNAGLYKYFLDQKFCINLSVYAILNKRRNLTTIKNKNRSRIEENNKITNQVQFILQAFNRIGINYKVVKYTNNKTPLEYEIYFDNTSFILNIDDFVDIYDKTQNNFDSFIMAIISTICNYKQNHR